MKIKVLLFFIGILGLILKLFKLIILNTWWIVLCFGLGFLLTYISIHNKNKDRNTPRPVYFAE